MSTAGNSWPIMVNATRTITMAAMAMRTERVRLGAIVTPPARRRPWKLARETMTLDRLSNGRLVLPVGLGALDDGAFGNVGEPTEARIRAEDRDQAPDQRAEAETHVQQGVHSCPDLQPLRRRGFGYRQRLADGARGRLRGREPDGRDGVSRQ